MKAEAALRTRSALLPSRGRRGTAATPIVTPDTVTESSVIRPPKSTEAVVFVDSSFAETAAMPGSDELDVS